MYILHNNVLDNKSFRLTEARFIFKRQRKNFFKKAVDKPGGRCYYALIRRKCGKREERRTAMTSKRIVTAAMEMYMCRMCMCFVMPFSEKFSDARLKDK